MTCIVRVFDGHGELGHEVAAWAAKTLPGQMNKMLNAGLPLDQVTAIGPGDCHWTR